MASEFDFLRAKWPKLAALAGDASRLVDIIPTSAMNSLKTYCEWCAEIALDLYEIQVPGGASQMEKLEALQASGFVPAEILQKFHNVRTASSRMVTDLESSTDLANACLSDCRDIGQWMFREADKEGFLANEGYTPTYGGVPIEGMRSHAPDPNMVSNEYKLARFMRQYGSYFTLAIAVIVIAGAIWGITALMGRRTEKLETPPFAMSATPIVTATPQPLTFEATPTPTSEIREYDFIDEVPITIKFDVGKMYTYKWNYKTKQDPFQIKNQVYNNGIGMFMLSDTIDKEWGKDSATWDLNGKYEKIQFDLGCDDSWSYGGSTDNGLYRVYIYADGELIWSTKDLNDSGNMYYIDVADDQVIVLPADTLQLEIRLSQKKGEKGTLSVVMGDFKLFKVKE